MFSCFLYAALNLCNVVDSTYMLPPYCSTVESIKTECILEDAYFNIA
jgi:hypothetical protein